jgi:hypothetical protein
LKKREEREEEMNSERKRVIQQARLETKFLPLELGRSNESELGGKERVIQQVQLEAKLLPLELGRNNKSVSKGN